VNTQLATQFEIEMRPARYQYPAEVNDAAYHNSTATERRFRFDNPDLGSYSLTASLSGFADFVIESLKARLCQKTVIVEPLK